MLPASATTRCPSSSTISASIIRISASSSTKNMDAPCILGPQWCGSAVPSLDPTTSRRACNLFSPLFDHFFAFSPISTRRRTAEERAAQEWDERVGLTAMRRDAEVANSAEQRAAMQMARTKPRTPAGAGALLA
jgi:hypothetical protein